MLVNCVNYLQFSLYKDTCCVLNSLPNQMEFTRLCVCAYVRKKKSVFLTNANKPSQWIRLNNCNFVLTLCVQLNRVCKDSKFNVSAQLCTSLFWFQYVSADISLKSHKKLQTAMFFFPRKRFSHKMLHNLSTFFYANPALIASVHEMYFIWSLFLQFTLYQYYLHLPS